MSSNENKGGRPAKSGKKPFTAIFQDLIGDSTQQDVADKIGVSRQNVGKWLSGTTTPDIDTLCKIADAYNVTTDYLLGRTDIKTPNTDLKAVCEYTGLSEKAVNILSEYAMRPKGSYRVVKRIDISSNPHSKSFIDIIDTNLCYSINVILEDEQIIYLLQLITTFAYFSSNLPCNIILKYIIIDLFSEIVMGYAGTSLHDEECFKKMKQYDINQNKNNEFQQKSDFQVDEEYTSNNDTNNEDYPF